MLISICSFFILVILLLWLIKVIIHIPIIKRKLINYKPIPYKDLKKFISHFLHIHVICVIIFFALYIILIMCCTHNETKETKAELCKYTIRENNFSYEFYAVENYDYSYNFTYLLEDEGTKDIYGSKSCTICIDEKCTPSVIIYTDYLIPDNSFVDMLINGSYSISIKNENRYKLCLPSDDYILNIYKDNYFICS